MSDIQQLIRRGKAAYEQRDYAAALTDFQEILRRNARFADIHHLTGLCLSFLGHPDEALIEFNEAIALNRRYVEAHISRAITLNELGRLEEGQQAFLEAAELETESEGPFPGAVMARLANAHAHLGDLYMEATAPSDAAEQYRAALSMRPHFHDIRTKLAQALLEHGDLNTAAAELQRVLSANPRAIPARLNLGLVYFRSGDRAAALREWEIAQAQQPANPLVRAYLGMLESHGNADAEAPQ